MVSITPMLAVTGPLPIGAGWVYEFKWDGVRAIAVLGDGKVRLFARSGAEITTAYPDLADLGAAGAGAGGQSPRDAVLDGEIVLLDSSGRPSFTALAERMHVRDRTRAGQLAAAHPVTYMIFDLLQLDKADLRRLPYAQRRETLERLPLAGRRWLVPPQFADGPATLVAARENALEGVVAKRLDAPYREGMRSGEWVKVKLDHTGEFVVGGWRPGARKLGAMLVGSPTPSGLAFRGRVGGGISAASERTLLAALKPLRAGHSPFAEPIPREDAKDAVWVRPELVVEVRYGNRTPDGRLRFPRFLRLRPDKTAEECVDE